MQSKRNKRTKVASIKESTADKLQIVLEALKADPKMTDETLAVYLSPKRLASARFWQLKALENLNTAEKGENEIGVSVRNAWATTGALTNGSVAKR